MVLSDDGASPITSRNQLDASHLNEIKLYFRTSMEERALVWGLV